MSDTTLSEQKEALTVQKIQTMVWANGDLIAVEGEDGLRDAIHDAEKMMWLDIWGDAEPYTDLLCSTFEFSPLLLKSIDEQVTRAKFVERTNYCHLIIHGLEYDSKTDEARTPELDIIFGKNFIVTVHRDQLAWLESLHQELSGQEGREHPLSKGMGYLLYLLLDSQVNSYFPVLDEIDGVIDELEDLTINDTSNAVQLRLFRIKRALSLMRRVISPQVEVANSLRGRTSRFIPENLAPYLNEVYDHMIRAFEILDSYRDLMSGLLDVYLSTVSNRLNVIMKQLAIVSTIFLPITFITGVFGQNFGHSPQVEHDNGYLFWIILAFMALVSLFQIWYFKTRKWI